MNPDKNGQLPDMSGPVAPVRSGSLPGQTRTTPYKGVLSCPVSGAPPRGLEKSKAHRGAIPIRAAVRAKLAPVEMRFSRP
jgi:hypothetical protein